MNVAVRFFLFLCLLCVGLTAAPALAEDRVVQIHFEDYPPYEYVSGGEPQGLNIDLMTEAFRRMGIIPDYTSMPWKRGVYELRNGGILALASGFKTPEREVFAFFPPEPLAMEHVYVVVPAVSGLEIDSLDDLRGLSIGVVGGYAYGEAFDSMVGLNKVEAGSNPQLLKMLLSQRMDVAIMNKAVARALAKEMGALFHIRFIYEVNSEPLYLLFSRARGHEAKTMSKQFGAALKAMRMDGTWARIESRY